MRRSLSLALGTAGLLAMGAGASDEGAVLEVVLNGRVVGDRVVILAADGDVRVPAELLRSEGLGELATGGEELVSLSTLAPRLVFEIDAPDARLRIRADPSLFAGSVVDLERGPPPGLERLRASSLFLNYALQVGDPTGGGSLDLDLPWELAGRVGPVAAISDFRFTTGPHGFVRLSSRLVFDDVEAARRVTLGDFVAATPELGSQLALGGLSVAKDFGLQPYVVTSPQPSITGVLETPSDVEVTVDGALVDRLHLPAGPFDLRSLPVRVGAGDVRVLIRDAFGRTREIGREFYAASRLLRRGAHQYAYQLGFRRERFGATSFDYGAPAFLAFHRVGATDWLTLGLRAELDEDVANAGGELALSLARLGELGFAIAASHEGGRTAGALSLGWAWRRGPVSAGLAAQAFGDGYATVAAPGGFPRPRLAASGGVSAGLGRLGSLSLFVSHERPRRAHDRTRAGLSYSRSITPRLQLNVGANMGYETAIHSDIGGSVTVFFGRRGTAAVRMRWSRDSLAAGLSAQWRPPLGTGFGGSFDLSESDLGMPRAPEGRARVEYRSPVGVASAEYRRFAARDGYRLGWAGSVVAVEGRMLASRPVSDGFALIRVSDLPDVLVSYNNEPIGRTDGDGVLVVPELRSQIRNRLGIEARQVPFGYRVVETARSVTVPFRGGGLVDFGVNRLRAYQGRLLLVTASGREPAAYGRLEIDDPGGGTFAAPVGSGGALYIEGLEPGSYPARVRHRGADCRFILELPDRPEPIADLGEIRCGEGG
jgi:outer membrane usher protein